MSEVHEAISRHSKAQHEKVSQFVKLEQMREFAIEEAISQCMRGEAFSVALINDVTLQINDLAKKGIVPNRQLVTVEMVQEVAERRKAQA